MPDGDKIRKDVVLVVDDEPEIRRMVTTVLSLAGLRAQVAANGQEGLECFVKHQSEISLVISDVLMPLMNGLQMAQRILDVEPNAKILMMSGYSDVALEIQARKQFAFIRKPFLMQPFMAKVRTLLNLPADPKFL